MRNWIEVLHAALAVLVPMAALQGLWWACTDELPSLLTGMAICYVAHQAINHWIHRRAAAEIRHLQASHNLPSYVDGDR